jgi:Holliday junction resolvasome RuvABC endonuclease subunit
MILAIDPGPTECGWALLYGRIVMDSGVCDQPTMLAMLRGACQQNPQPRIAIEMIASYGRPVGAEVFETCVMIGRMVETCAERGVTATLVTRLAVKQHVCNSGAAKDPHIRQALIDLLGPQGTKAKPGPTYGVKSHAWAALGVAVTVAGLKPEGIRNAA